MESSIINGTMLIQIALLAWFFIDEKITLQEGIGMAIAAIGAVLVQIKLNRTKKQPAITHPNNRSRLNTIK